MKKTPTAPRAEYATTAITPTMAAYADWLKAETGYDVDPLSVQLAGTMRVAFQKSDGNRVRLAAATEKATAAAAARVERRAAREQAAIVKANQSKPDKAPAKPKTTKPKGGSTIATADGVVIAEQRHVDATSATPRRRRPAAPASVEAVAE